MHWNDEPDDDPGVPLAPTYREETDDEDSFKDPTAAPTSDDDGHEPAGDTGVSDGDRVVRVWVEHGRLTKVRVSPHWHTKLQRSRRELGTVVTQVLELAHIGVAPTREIARPEVTLTPEFARSLPGLDYANLGRLVAAHDAMLEQVRRERETSPEPPTQPAVTGKSRGVTVTLDDRGCAVHASFDEKWLQTTQSSVIAVAILAAAHEAYASFQAAKEPGEGIDPLREGEFIRQMMYTMLLPPEDR